MHRRLLPAHGDAVVGEPFAELQEDASCCALCLVAQVFVANLAREGITVNTLLPGAFETDRVMQVQRATSAQQGITMEEVVQRVARGIPVGRMGKPSEFGAIAAFLASPLAGYITGSTIRLDGGSVRSV